MGTIDKLSNVLGGVILKVRMKTRENLNPYFAPWRRKRLKKQEFTIVSNNCWAGHVYRYFGISYKTPTVGLYFFADDYLKLLKNLQHYMNTDLVFIPLSESKHRSELLEHGGKSATCPIGVLDDIEVIFLHYKTEQEAYQKWMRRKSRMVWDNIYVKMSQMNGCTEEMMNEFDSLPYYHKFIFVKQPYGLNSEVVYKGYEHNVEIANDTNNFRRYISLTKWLNGESFN